MNKEYAMGWNAYLESKGCDDNPWTEITDSGQEWISGHIACYNECDRIGTDNVKPMQVEMEYPKTRRVTWVNDETGELEGQCDYVRIDITEDLYSALRSMVANAQQSEFEQWLDQTSPSGCVDEVNSRWIGSSAYSEFCDEYASELAALYNFSEFRGIK